MKITLEVDKDTSRALRLGIEIQLSDVNNYLTGVRARRDPESPANAATIARCEREIKQLQAILAQLLAAKV